jgi:DMSO/TMAO reductase YedYZ molybdopterin-dependent catalytic subunit
MEPHATFRFKRRAEDMTAPVTATDDVFVLAHFGVPRISVEDWRLTVGGLVRRPCTLSIDDIRQFPKVEIESVIKCAGFPHDATIATRTVSNAVWAGADLSAVLDACGLDAETRFIWASAPDHGTYARWSADRYRKDLPIERVREGGVLLAYELNGEPLPQTHGFPVRLFVPGFYGTNSVKWLCKLEAAATRAPGTFTAELYNDRTGDGGLAPVWRIAPEALIVAPADHSVVDAGPTTVWGWCWGAREIATVDVSIDGGETWCAGTVTPRRQWSWQRFALDCDLPRGRSAIVARATDVAGATQPFDKARNAVHRIDVTAA